MKFLAGGFAGGLLGTTVAGFESGRIEWRMYVVAQATITAFHLMTHYSNDYFDRECDECAVRTPYSGGSGVLFARGEASPAQLSPNVALYAALGCAAVGTALAAALAFSAPGFCAAFIAAGIGLLAWSYSAPPLRLCARGLGEAATALVVGTLVPLVAYCAQRGPPSGLALLVAIPGTAAIFAMMLAVEYPDIAADTLAGKRNIVVRLGPRASRLPMLTAVAAVYAAVATAVTAGAPPAYALLEALTLPLAFDHVRALVAYVGGGQADEALAGRGVALYFLVTICGALGFAAVLR